MRALLLPTFALLAACASSPRPTTTSPAAEAAAAPAAVRFLPADYTAEVFTDYAAMRRIGLLDRIERLPMMASWLEATAFVYGSDIDDLQQVRTALVCDRAAAASRSMRMVSVASVDPGAEPLSMSSPWQPWDRGSMRGFRSRETAVAAVVVQPAPGIVVAGDLDLVEPLLAGPGGRPHPELRSFAAGERLLFQYAAATLGRPAHTLTGTIGFYGHDDPDDPCEVLRLRLAEDADGGLVLSAAMRYRKGSANLRRTEEDVRAFVDRTRGDAQLASLKPLLDALVVAHDENTVHLSLVLGPPRDAIRTLERAMIGLMAAANARAR